MEGAEMRGRCMCECFALLKYLTSSVTGTEVEQRVHMKPTCCTVVVLHACIRQV